MSKKHRYFKDDRKKGRKKSGKSGKRRSIYGEPKFKTVKPSLDKKEAKANRKVVMSPVEVPKEFLKNRRKCNHGGSLITVSEYKSMTPNWAAYTPALERMVAHYGEEHVHICRDCYDVVVDRDQVSADDVAEALSTLYAACNICVANRRMKEDEVKATNKLKEVIDDFRPVIDILQKIADEGGQNKGTRGGSNDDDDDNTGAPVGGINSNSGSAFVR